MARVKRGKNKNLKRKRLLAKTKGFRSGKSKLKRQAKEATLHAGKYAFAGRKNKKRNIRKLWIQRITAASKTEGLSYNRLISSLKKEDIILDRKILSDLAQSDPLTFQKIVKLVK
jgi:large subunit ribosomal protein L20